MSAILVVDDEASLRRSITRLLVREGRSIVSLADGHEAIAHFRQAEPPIVLALLDMQMPAMSGIEIFRALRAISPRLPVIFMSGRSLAAVGQEVGHDERVATLDKPFEADTLRSVVDHMITRFA